MKTWSSAILATAFVAAAWASQATAQAVNPADGEGLVVDYPVFQPVVAPSGYTAAIAAGTRTEASWQERLYSLLRVRKCEP